jgi:ribonuclease III
MAGLHALMERLGHAFREPALLERALTHKSRVHEARTAGTDNEQLEFLGDAVLGYLVSELLVQRHPAFPEGRLSKLRARIVNAQHLSDAARFLQLGEYLILGRGEEMSGGRQKKALLADALEAVIAALYLDGGIDPARAFVVRCIMADLPPEEEEGAGITDSKSALQELAQARKLPVPRYHIVAERGPEHSKTFTVEVRVGKEHSSQAEGPSKKDAGQKAAASLLKQLS